MALLLAQMREAIDQARPFPTEFDAFVRLAQDPELAAAARPATAPNNNQITLKGQQFLSSFSFPNFYFHATTAHGILRHNGVEIGKRDFLGVK